MYTLVEKPHDNKQLYYNEVIILKEK